MNFREPILLVKKGLKKTKKIIVNINKADFLIFVLLLSTWLKLILFNFFIYDGYFSLVFLLFTLGTSVLIFSPAILFGRLKVYIAFFIAFIASFVIWANAVYFRFFESLIKVESLAVARFAVEAHYSVWALIKPKDLIFFIDIFVFFALFLFFKKRFLFKGIKKSFLLFGFMAVFSLLVISIIFYKDREDYLERFIYRNFDVNQIEQRYGVFGTHAINAYRYLFVSNKRITPEREEEVVDWAKNNKIGQSINEFTSVASGRNVFIVQLESFQSFVVNKKFENQEVTPNLNRFINDSYFFPNGQYIRGGGNTSDSDFSTNTSFYPFNDRSVFVNHGRNDFTSLPKALAKSGYGSYAYHGFRRDFWNRNLSFNSLGFDRFYAADNYSDGVDIIMGLNDRDFFKESVDKIKKKDGPNYHYLISLTSHYPFEMAQEHQLLSGNISDYDFRTFHYLQSVHYADMAFGYFLEGLKREGLYEDSLIVVYGDHDAVIGDLGDPKTLKTLGIDKIDYEKLYGLEKVPFVIKLPGQNEKIIKDKVISQIDIMPTVLNLVGVKTDFPMFGLDVFEDRGSRYFSVVHSLSGLSVFGDLVFFSNSFLDDNAEKCFDKSKKWQEVDIGKCQYFVKKGKLEREFSNEITRHNLFRYFF